MRIAFTVDPALVIWCLIVFAVTMGISRDTGISRNQQIALAAGFAIFTFVGVNLTQGQAVEP